MSLLNVDGNPMRYNNLGDSGLMVSEVSFGTMTFSDVDKAATGTGKGMRAEAAYGMLEACYKGGVNFFDCAERSLGARVNRTDGLVEYGDRTTRIGAFPLGIDFELFESLALKNGAPPKNPDERVVLGVDRLDYTKGLRQRIRAVGELFKEGKLDPHEVVFLQLATPSRERVEEYKILRDDINLLVGQINSKVGSIANRALVYRNESVPREVLAAMYQMADLMLVTPVRDGMNLVAKEYIACRSNDDSALVLSEFAGAARELKQAYMVNPYDIDGMKATIMKALTDSPKIKARKMRSMRRQVFDKTIDVWADNFLTELEGQ